MSAPTKPPVMVRIWAAVKDDAGRVRCHVEDLPNTHPRALAFTTGEEDRRPFRWHVADRLTESELDSCKGWHCEPGNPCPACQLVAISWWDEWEVRRQKDLERAAKEAEAARQGRLF